MAPHRLDLEALYRDRHLAFRNALVGIAGSVEAGADAMQEGFARALVRLEQFRGEGTLGAWVWRICLNEAWGQRRGPDRIAVAKGTRRR